MPAVIDRRGRLCEQQPPKLTGIDFVQVADSTQKELRVFFIVEPDVVEIAAGPTFMVDTAAAHPWAFGGTVAIKAVGDEANASQLVMSGPPEYQSVPVGGGLQRIALCLKFETPGGFSNYRLTIDDPAVDPFLDSVIFSFKQGCDTGFDCRVDATCPPDNIRDVEVDYLARDFASLNSALNDFAARYYPEWGERIPADLGVMITELFAALGDELSYIQDRFALEAYLETATQRRSLMRLARLVDYLPDPGRNASCLLSLQLANQAPASPAQSLKFTDRLRFWAVPEGQLPIPFELGDSLEDGGELLAHSSWNAMKLYLPDAGDPCLPAGATELLLAPAATNDRLPLSSQIAGGGQAWIGRTMILLSRPADLSVPARAWPITIKEVDMTAADPLVLQGGNPTQLTRILWGQSQALPNAVRIAETVLLGNVAPAVSGRTVVETFRVGPPSAATMAGTEGWPQAVEREGASDGECERSPAILYGLAASESEGVNHIGEHDLMTSRMPDIRLRELSPKPGPWTYEPTLLEADEDDPVFTLDPGIWRQIIRYQRQGLTVAHSDYASNSGFTLRFGGGEFGLTPDLGAAFEVSYRTALGKRSNVGADTVTTIDPPNGDPRQPQLAIVERVTNPLPASGGVDSESPEEVRQNAPEFYRGFPMNAVRDEHFREIVEREPWVQRAGSQTRWTGSWLRHFVTADPVNSFAYTPAERARLSDVVDAVRMAGRDAVVRDPRYAPLDLEISICVAPGFYSGQVREAVLTSLTGASQSNAALFDPDNFTFGQALWRASIEAFVQSVPGVLGVTGICLRRRGAAGWEPFAEASIKVGSNEIIQVDNNADHPERGSIRVRVTQSAAHDSGCACCVP